MQVLKTLRETGPKRLFCVFGAGGDRDKTKRPKMGVVAVNFSDFSYVTSDNPRTESPSAILDDIEAGIRAIGKTNYVRIEDRAAAIKKAISDCQEGDILLIAGKGHEDYQIIGTQKYHFSDFEVAREAISQCN
jgi:UDP-N-acetylmuramoyl-L-alanyl-D-glutamate--2,6-diaminopimelate ligase